jgi:hypothetical protein
MLDEFEDDIFGDGLDGAGDVDVALGDGGVGEAGRAAEELIEVVIGHAPAGEEIEVT